MLKLNSRIFLKKSVKVLENIYFTDYVLVADSEGLETKIFIRKIRKTVFFSFQRSIKMTKQMVTANISLDHP